MNTTDRNLWAALSERRLPPLRVSPSASRQTGQPQRTDGKQEDYLPDTSGLLSQTIELWLMNLWDKIVIQYKRVMMEAVILLASKY